MEYQIAPVERIGQYLKTLDGYSQRVQCMELVDTEVWSGSSNGTIVIFDAKVKEEKVLISF
jgi:hypothetical protein